MTLGKRIENLRKSKNMSQSDLGELLFVSDKTISSYENNRTEPNLDMLIKLSNILDCNTSYLIYGDKDKNNIETEIKIKLDKNEYNNLNTFMKKNATYINENNQLDTYYNPTYRSFIDKDNITEWLRIGKRGNKTILNYKNWYENKYCDEYEVEIDNFDNLDKIFKILNINKLVTVDKHRIVYSYLNKYEIALDYVKDLGYFVEIEVKRYDKSSLEEYDELLKIAKSLNLNLSNIKKCGYPEFFIKK